MVKLILFVLVCEFFTFISSEAPAFCRGAECPVYNVHKKTEDYEIRQYGPLTWVSTNYIGKWQPIIIGEMFKNLFDYIQGNNTQKKQLDIPVPLLTQFQELGDGKRKYSMNILIPAANINKIPLPLTKKIRLVTIPSATFFVRSFIGNADILRYLQEIQKLINSVKNPKSYYDKLFYTATYDSPAIEKDRYNEVWLLQKPQN